MAKTIKFNLRIDGKAIRSLEDLRENFVIDDLVEFYDQGLLQKWLSVRGYNEHARKIQSFKRTDDEKLIAEMINIFEIPMEKRKFEEELLSLKYKKDRQRILEETSQLMETRTALIDKYHDEYERLLLSLKEHKDDYPSIKVSLDMIQNFYRRLFKVDVVRLFYELKEEAPLAIFAMLMNEELRKELELNDVIDNELSKIYEDEKILARLGQNLKTFQGATDGYWKNLCDSGNKYMVVSMVGGNFVGSPGDIKREYSAIETNGFYLILDGLIYKSNNPSHPLRYMEV